MGRATRAGDYFPQKNPGNDMIAGINVREDELKKTNQRRTVPLVVVRGALA